MVKKQRSSGDKPGLDVLLLGAAGQLGEEIVTRMTTERVMPRSREMLDITNTTAVANIISALKPKIVINAAGTQPAIVSSVDPRRHWAVNAYAVANLVKTCAINGSALIHLSTSDVFGQASDQAKPFTEFDPIGPVGLYAASKAAGEHAILQLSQYPCREFANFKYWVIRTSLPYGRPTRFRQNLVHSRIEQAVRSRIPICAPKTLVRSFTYIPHLVTQLLWLIENHRVVPSGVYHIANKGEASYHRVMELACHCLNIKVSSLLADCDRQLFMRHSKMTVDEFPAYGALDCRAWDEMCPIAMPEWSEGVEEFCDDYARRMA